MPNQVGFQTVVNNELPIGVPGDFAGANPKTTVVAPPFGFVAPAAGCLVAAFGWGDPATGLAGNYFKPNSSLGFVHREGQALETTFLGIATQLIPSGLRVTLYNQGDFIATFIAGATVGQKVYCDPVTGLCTANATGNGVTASNTGASIASNVLTTTDADATGTVAVGQAVYGGTIPEGTYISSADGTGSGTHLWNLTNLNGTAIPNNTGPFTVSAQGVIETPFQVASNVKVNAVGATSSIAAPVAPGVGGILTVGSLSSGTFVAGQFLTGTGLPASANAQILYQLTGTTGGAGTYQTNYNGVAVTSTTITGTQGQSGKISSWATSSSN